MPEEFENVGFKLKTHQMFSVHTKMQQSPVMLDLRLSKIQPEKSRLSWRYRF